MMQNLRSLRQRIEALADKQCKLAVYPHIIEHIIDQSANKIPYDSLSNLESY